MGDLILRHTPVPAELGKRAPGLTFATADFPVFMYCVYLAIHSPLVFGFGFGFGYGFGFGFGTSQSTCHDDSPIALLLWLGCLGYGDGDGDVGGYTIGSSYMPSKFSALICLSLLFPAPMIFLLSCCRWIWYGMYAASLLYIVLPLKWVTAGIVSSVGGRLFETLTVASRGSWREFSESCPTPIPLKPSVTYMANLEKRFQCPATCRLVVSLSGA